MKDTQRHPPPEPPRGTCPRCGCERSGISDGRVSFPCGFAEGYDGSMIHGATCQAKALVKRP